MTRRRHSGISDQRKASIHRLRDAQALFEKERWRGAMYLAGYAVECRLKHVLMRAWRCFTLQELEENLTERGISISPFTHSLHSLLKMLGAVPRMEANRRAWTAFTLVNEWQPSWRYSPALSNHRESLDFFEAVGLVIMWIDHNC